MIKLNSLSKMKGYQKPKRRVGRGYGSGRAKTSGRGTKGQGARGNRGSKPGFEGGQVRMLIRLPKKKGFRSLNKRVFQVVNLEKLNQLSAGAEVTPETFLKNGWVKTIQKPIKILGSGELKLALNFKKEHFEFSAKAQKKIIQAGGAIN